MHAGHEGTTLPYAMALRDLDIHCTSPGLDKKKRHMDASHKLMQFIGGYVASWNIIHYYHSHTSYTAHRTSGLPKVKKLGGGLVT